VLVLVAISQAGVGTMASSGSIFNQRLRETVGLASITKDGDLTAASARLSELQGDVAVLRKVLETYNKALNTQVPAAKAQMTSAMVEFSSKLVGPSNEASTFFRVFGDVHKFMDVDLPGKLNTAFEAAVVTPLEEWAKSLDDVKADLKSTDEKRVVSAHACAWRSV
jgi:hypothetical protein